MLKVQNLIFFLILESQKILRNIKEKKQYNTVLCIQRLICKKYKVLYNFNLKLKTFEVLEIVVKSGDQNYTIQQIVGGFFYRENFSNCYKKQNEIALDIQDLFDKDVKKKSYEKDHSADKTGESKNNTIQFTFKTKDVIRVSCYDWSEKITKEKNWVDSLRVSILGANFRNWINNKAYK